MLVYTEADLQRLIDHQLDERIDKGEEIRSVAAWRADARRRHLESEAARPGFILRSVAALDRTDGRAGRNLRQPAEVLRRLYRAKLDDLARVGVPAHERTAIALDYACGEIHRCDIAPMPPRGVVALEDELRSEIEALS